MKRIATLLFLVLAVTLVAGAADQTTVKGYLMDKMCGGAHPEKASSHAKACAEKCSKSGFGVVADGKFIGFDEKGDKLAANLLKKSKKTEGIEVEVKGTQEGDKIAVTNIKESGM